MSIPAILTLFAQSQSTAGMPAGLALIGVISGRVCSNIA